MNVMTQAHKTVKEAIKAQVELGNGRTHTYAQMLSLALKMHHKEFKAMQAKAAAKDAKFTVVYSPSMGEWVAVDIRTLPLFNANQETPEVESGWTIKGTMKGEQRYTEQVSGFSQSTLKRHLEFWSNADKHGYTDLCLMLVVDGMLYRLVK